MSLRDRCAVEELVDKDIGGRESSIPPPWLTKWSSRPACLYFQRLRVWQEPQRSNRLPGCGWFVRVAGDDLRVLSRPLELIH